MPNYKESQVAGSEYTRCRIIEIRNPKDNTPSVMFHEERAIVLNDRSILEPAGVFGAPFTDPAKVINILNPETGEDTGNTITWGELYAVMYSAYLQEAAVRDATPTEPQP